MIWKILRKHRIKFAVIVAISWFLFYQLATTLVDPQNYKHILAITLAYLLGGVSVGISIIVANKRPGNLRVYKITKDSDDYAEYEEITPIK